MLRSIMGMSLLEHVYKRALKSDFPVYVCTSTEPSDDKIAQESSVLGVKCFRGNLNNVASRFIEGAKKFGLETVVRISGDSPFICSEIIKEAVSHFDNSLHLVTNIFPRTFPPGQSVEVINMKKYRDEYNRFSDQEDFEHVTKFFYKNHTDMAIKNFRNSEDLSRLRMVIDTKEDFDRISSISERNPEIFSLPFAEIRKYFETKG